MSKAQFLQSLGLTQAELTDLLTKFSNFTESLSENQKSVLQKSLPTMDQAVQTLGPGVTAEDLQDALERGPSSSVVFCVCVSGPPPPPLSEP